MADDDDTIERSSLFLSESKMPYVHWIDEAYRMVMCRALDYFSRHGRVGGHHFFITFRTDFPGVDIPQRLREQYPHEMTVVFRNQFWDLSVDHQTHAFSVTLSFSGVSSRFLIPFKAVTRFADPAVHLDLYFLVETEEKEEINDTEKLDITQEREASESAADPPHSVVSLDAFRKKKSVPPPHSL
ncbi:MAG: hypothetical protein J6P00_06225 [Acetobacter sp.]|nr:hypothetical protein [Acetobacter sp.]